MAATNQPKALFDDSSSSESEDQADFYINKKYAKEFQSRKQTEELKRVQLEQGDESDESDESSEDEDGHLLTPSVDVNIFKTLNALRQKEDKIYDPSVRFFDNDETNGDDEEEPVLKKTKPKRYKDVVREQVLEQMEKEDNRPAAENQGKDSLAKDDNKKSRLAYDVQQQELRRAFLESTGDDSDQSNDEDEGLLIVKQKSRKDQEEDDEETEQARKALEQELNKLQNCAPESKLRLVDPKGEVEDGEQFLLNYFKNRTWIDKDNDNESDEDLTEVVHHKPTGTGDPQADDDDDDSLQQVEQADDFESQYNFRFEQAASQSGADFSMIGYARGQTMNTLRRKDESRREKRQARKEKKAAERKAKEEQLKRLKNAKRQEMEKKLQQVKSVLGVAKEQPGAAIDEEAILKLMEGDFDPEKFEELMMETYGDGYYQQEDTEWKTDQDVRESLKRDEDGALLIGQDDPDGGLYDNVEDDDETGQNPMEAKSQDEYDEDDYPEDWPEEEGYEEEPETELEKKVKAKMQDELYKLDYEDIVAGMPTRFKYRQVKANSYGLSTEEILFARDSTLKQFVSLKKMAPYREEEEEHFVGSKKRRRFRDLLKQDLEEQLAKQEGTAHQQGNADMTETADGSAKKKKRRRLKKGKRRPEESELGKDVKPTAKEEVKDMHKDVAREKEPKSKKRRRKKKKSIADDSVDTPVAEQKDENTVLFEQPQKKEAPTVKKDKKKKKKPKKTSIDGVPDSRLASYGF